jgi:hypothetical protein
LAGREQRGRAAERQPRHEERHGEADPAEPGNTMELAPRHAARQSGEARADGGPREERDPQWFAEHQPEEDPKRDRIRQTPSVIPAGQRHARVCQREERHDAERHEPVKPLLHPLERRLRLLAEGLQRQQLLLLRLIGEHVRLRAAGSLESIDTPLCAPEAVVDEVVAASNGERTARRRARKKVHHIAWSEPRGMDRAACPAALLSI